MGSGLRRAVAIVAIVIGVGIAAEPLVLKLFPRSAAGERVTDRFRSTMSSEGLAALQTNFHTVGAFTNQLIGQAMPAFAHELGMTDAEFKRYVSVNFPAVATGVKEIPPAAEFVGPVIPQLVAARPDFESVDTLPGLGLPITSIPWLLLGLGGGLIAIGVIALKRPGRVPLVLALVVGLGMVVVPIALSLPPKANDAKSIAAVGAVALSQDAADKALAATKVIDATMDETQHKMLPAIGQRLGLSPQAMSKSVEASFPAVAAGLQQWPSIRPGAYQLAAIQGQSVADNKQMNNTPFRALPWLIIVPGALLALLAVLALLGGSSSPPDKLESPTD